MIKEIITITINSEEHLGETLKKQCVDYINNLELENKKLKEDINFCLHSIKQEMDMSKDERTRKEMTSCYDILKRWNK